eukprot:TRINITY_DN2222_c0_g2_i2.p1 TRINITY_DN2222_c0_g2~~TRINITY_DN2222_c0_g2_i2.p1  ORF type:complete len:169 (+),score=20.34 TRINITY_DN2222_c0_g2_i2:38-508(+)
MYQGDNDDALRPCEHNDWDDVRTRHGYKLLRCRVCQGRWKLPNNSVPRCVLFLHEKCAEGPSCGLLHVRRKKSSICERYEQFGDSVLQGVAPRIQKITKRHARVKKVSLAEVQNSEPLTRSAEQGEATSSSSASSTPSTYSHCPYTWGDVSPPSFM